MKMTGTKRIKLPLITMTILVNLIWGQLAERSILFNDQKSEQRLVGTVFRRVFVQRRVTCAMFCALEPECRSYNFRITRVCELNSGDAYSTCLASFESNSATEYWGLTREQVPVCREGDRIRSITNEDLPNYCQIGKKRQDAAWIQVGGQSEPICVAPAHGGLSECPERETESSSSVGTFPDTMTTFQVFTKIGQPETAELH